MEHYFELEPRDLLFMRDARPMEAQDIGSGASWPRCDQLASALHHAFMLSWPERQTWESIDGAAHTFRNKKEDQFKAFSKDKNTDSSCRFGSLKVMGPFPKKQDEIYLPCPADLGMRLVVCEDTNLPAPLTHAFLPRTQEKVTNPQWISISDYAHYLNGEELSGQSETLGICERRIGIALDDETRTASKSKLYQAEYLRLEKGVSLAFAAECMVKQRVPPMLRDDKRVVKGETDVFAMADAPREMIFGGQHGLVSFTEKKSSFDKFKKLCERKMTTRFVRWTLISPCIFKSGWLPGWIANDRVMLPRENIIRQANESRADYKRRQQESIGIDAKLIAARIGKPIVFSGWNMIANAPKANQTAVPAGSSYVFECKSVEEANVLARQLNAPSRRSDEQGEKGFGIGICSSIEM